MGFSHGEPIRNKVSVPVVRKKGGMNRRETGSVVIYVLQVVMGPAVSDKGIG